MWTESAYSGSRHDDAYAARGISVTASRYTVLQPGIGKAQMCRHCCLAYRPTLVMLDSLELKYISQ
jgi:hypothetical protein